MDAANNTASPNELSKEFLQNIFLQAGDGIFLIGEDSTILESNPRGCEILGYAREELLGQPVLKFQPPEELERMRRELYKLAVDGHVTTESIFIRKDGSHVPVEITGRLLSNNQIVGVLRDISRRKRDQQALIESEQKYRRLVEHCPDGIIIVDEEGRIIEWNFGQQKISGLQESDALGKFIWDVQLQLTPQEYASDELLESLKRKTMQVLQTGRETWQIGQPMEGTLQTPDGTLRNVELMMYTYKTARGYRAGSITRDISKRKQIEMLLEYMAMHDPLTDLPNRMLLENRLIHALDRVRRESNRKLAVMMLDIDHFKEVNDSFGHAFGDQLLKVIGQRIQSCLRKSDTAARMGGDEFAIIAESITDVKDAERIALKVIESICMPMEIEGRSLAMTTSIGISICHAKNCDAGQLLREADIAMYQAKQLRNCHQFFDPS